jgi:FlaA1/EpsC-like NDP-sugar epimerase
LVERAVGGRSVLITGAGGSIGSGLARAVLAGRPGKLMLLDLSESALYESWRTLIETAGAATRIVPIVGSVLDSEFLRFVFDRDAPQVVFHAAAYKHVQLMEENAFSAFRNNSVGTYRLALAARAAGVERLISVSTDKAVNPTSVMGASKRIAESIVLSHSMSETRMNVVRLCNVLGSSGSVATIFREQAADGRPLTVTDARAERYFLLPAEAEMAILRAAVSPIWGRVLIPDCGEPVRILDLARRIAAPAGGRVASEFPGLRPGEKLCEELRSSDEVPEFPLLDGLRVMRGAFPVEMEVAALMRGLESALGSFEMDRLLTAVRAFVPAFRLASTDIACAKAREK